MDEFSRQKLSFTCNENLDGLFFEFKEKYLPLLKIGPESKFARKRREHTRVN